MYKWLLITCIMLAAMPLAAQDSSFTNTIGMTFVRIRPGSFVMGAFLPPYPEPPAATASAENGYRAVHYALAKKEAARDARPGFTAVIRHPFYMGTFEVTQKQWKAVMGSNPSVFQKNPESGDADAHPVENVSWQDVQLFLKKLNALETGKRYRLPTEQEWEYAARAGALGDIPWAQIRQQAQLDTRTTNNVGGKAPNAWGLYDMLGNVWEWVQDVYNDKPFTDPAPPPQGTQHVLKGASFAGDVKNATYMTHAAGPGNGWDVGFRIVLEAAD